MITSGCWRWLQSTVWNFIEGMICLFLFHPSNETMIQYIIYVIDPSTSKVHVMPGLSYFVSRQPLQAEQ